MNATWCLKQKFTLKAHVPWVTLPPTWIKAFCDLLFWTFFSEQHPNLQPSIYKARKNAIAVQFNSPRRFSYWWNQWLRFIYLPHIKATIITVSVRVNRAQFSEVGRNFLALSITYFTVRDCYQIYVWHNRKKKHIVFDQDPTFSFQRQRVYSIALNQR